MFIKHNFNMLIHVCLYKKNFHIYILKNAILRSEKIKKIYPMRGLT